MRLRREIAHLGRGSRGIRRAESNANNIKSKMIEHRNRLHCSSACKVMMEESSAQLLTGQETFLSELSTNTPCISAPTFNW